MAIHGFSHLAVGVRDMERSLAFYRDVIGLQVSADQIEEFPAFSGGEPLRRRGVYLHLGPGPHASFLVLDQQLSRDPFGAPAQLFQVGTHHFSFWVDDVAAVAERAAAAGCAVLMKPQVADTKDYGEAPGGKILSSFLRDPDGNVVQLDQRL